MRLHFLVCALHTPVPLANLKPKVIDVGMTKRIDDSFLFKYGMSAKVRLLKTHVEEIHLKKIFLLFLYIID